MDNFLIGVAGGLVPAILMLVVYFISFAGRFAKMENDISWLKQNQTLCQLHSKTHSL